MKHLTIIIASLLFARFVEASDAARYEAIPVRTGQPADAQSHAEPIAAPSGGAAAPTPTGPAPAEPQAAPADSGFGTEPDPVPAPTPAPVARQREPRATPQQPVKEWPEYDPNDRWLPEPEEQVEEGPYLARFSTWSEVPREIRYEVERPTLIVLGECGLNERNRNGRYNTWCIPCNNAAGTAWTLNKWVSVGDKPSDQIQILDTEDDNGHAVAIEFGKNGRKITDDGTPVLIVQYPDRPTKVVRGWTRGYGTRDGQWFMLGLLGIRLENPMSWPGYAAQAGMYSPLGLACWAHLDGCRGDAYSVGRVDLRSLIEFLYGSQGRREIAPGVFLTCPVDARIEFDRAATHPRLHFPNGGPAFEFKKWPFKLKRSITSVDCDWDLGRVAIFVEGIDYPLVIQVDQGRPVDYAPQFSRN